MNRTKLKNYAPQARREFILAVTQRAAVYGLTKEKIEPISEQGDVAIIGGKPFNRSLADKRRRLEERIARHGFEPVMEAVAYTWFNRLVAIRFMELHGYLDHGYRVLSYPDKSKLVPEIVEHAEHITLSGLDEEKIIALKLDGTKEAELYRMLLIAQCNALSSAMPFLFERIDDETELLLPDNLLNSDSLIRKLVAEIDEEDWQHVEIIGWLYQFYISDKKTEVIGKVVKSEDIPAATQLFTPNWIVKYLVQNSLGRKWVATYPDSPLRQKMAFYIEPAEQTPEVQAQLAAITPTSLNPEELTLMDPACGSGHILVEAYDVLKEVYLERGYRLRDIPKLILTKNLFGLEIDDRAAQLAAFALMMKARSDDRRLFDGPVPTNVLAIQESNGLNVNAIVQAFTEKKITNEDDLETGEFGFMANTRSPLFAVEHRPASTVDDKFVADLKALLSLFEHGKTYGSLLKVPPSLASKIDAIAARAADLLVKAELSAQFSARVMLPLIRQAQLLVRQYDIVVANPPYMGSKSLNGALRAFASSHYPRSKSDLFAMFIERNCQLTYPHGYVGFMTPFVWMFIASYQDLRSFVTNSTTIASLVHPEYNVFWESAHVPICSFVLRNSFSHATGEYVDLRGFYGADLHVTKLLEAARNCSCGWRHSVSSADFVGIPGSPIAYWISDRMRKVFSRSDVKPLGSLFDVKKGLITLDDARFLRRWHEVPADRICFDAKDRAAAVASKAKWFPINKGGGFRRWFGYNDSVINWEHDGAELKQHISQTYGGGSYTKEIRSESLYFKEGITWGSITAAIGSFRFSPTGSIFSSGGPCMFAGVRNAYICGQLNSIVAQRMLEILCPTLNFVSGDIAKLPILVADNNESRVQSLVKRAIELAAADWNSFEVAPKFQMSPLLEKGIRGSTIEQSFLKWTQVCEARNQELRTLEKENNRLFISAYGLAEDLHPDVSDNQNSLTSSDLCKDSKRLLSFCVGCSMGRYSLDQPGLVYADSGNDGFDCKWHKTFPADADGIIPITGIDWFEGAAARQFEQFAGVAWPKEHLEENQKFVADSLGAKSSEQPRDTIRRYFADDFYKDHLQTYKRRPIYWMFSSGSLGAFQCLVYLHRYNEGTLARMRTEYVIPLQGKINARIDQLEGDKMKAAPTHKKRLEKEQEFLKKQKAEVIKFDEKLRHYADLRIKLDLNDGVKVNYGKFGDLLANVLQVCGKGEEAE